MKTLRLSALLLLAPLLAPAQTANVQQNRATKEITTDIVLPSGKTLRFVEGSAPSTPPTDQVVVYPKSDGKLYWKDDTGTEYGIATLAGVEALSNKTITDSAFNGTVGATTPSTGFFTVATAGSPSTFDSMVKFGVSSNTGTIPAGIAGTLIQIAGADGANVRFALDSWGGIPIMQFRRANGTLASKSAVLSGDIFGLIGGSGYLATGYQSGSSAQIRFNATENWSDSTSGSSITFVTTGNSAGGTRTFTFGQDGYFTVPGGIITPTQTPSSASATGVAGTVTWDTSYIYVCTATNTWKRVAISTW